MGVGIDVVGIDRLRTALARTPGPRRARFSNRERASRRRASRPGGAVGGVVRGEGGGGEVARRRHLRRDVARHRAARRRRRGVRELVVGGPAGSVADSRGVVGWTHRIDADDRRGSWPWWCREREPSHRLVDVDGPDRGGRHLLDPVVVRQVVGRHRPPCETAGPASFGATTTTRKVSTGCCGRFADV